MTSCLVLAIPSLIRNHQSLAFALLAFVLYVAFVYAREWLRVRRSRAWLTASGRIHDVAADPQITTTVDYWRVSFRYTYTVAGTDYTGKYSVNCTTQKQSLQAWASLAQATATVHYDPHHPATSVLWENEVWELY